MTDLQQMSRILYHHDWTNVEDWARNVDWLADLSDEEIGQLEECDNGRCTCDASLVASGRVEQPSLIDRCRQSFFGFCESLRFGLRRTC